MHELSAIMEFGCNNVFTALSSVKLTVTELEFWFIFTIELILRIPGTRVDLFAIFNKQVWWILSLCPSLEDYGGKYKTRRVNEFGNGERQFWRGSRWFEGSPGWVVTASCTFPPTHPPSYGELIKVCSVNQGPRTKIV